MEKVSTPLPLLNALGRGFQLYDSVILVSILEQRQALLTLKTETACCLSNPSSSLGATACEWEKYVQVGTKSPHGDGFAFPWNEFTSTKWPSFPDVMLGIPRSRTRRNIYEIIRVMDLFSNRLCDSFKVYGYMLKTIVQGFRASTFSKDLKAEHVSNFLRGILISPPLPTV